MAVNNVDENAKESKTVTTPYGGGNTNNPGPNVNSPSIHDLAVQSAEETYGPDAHNNPKFDDYVKDREAQMLDAIEKTKRM
jgi:hypothetical protein